MAAPPLAAQTLIVPPNLHPSSHRTNLVISEFRYRMVGTSDFLPFVKITNAGPETIDLTGHRIAANGTSSNVLSGTVLAPAQSYMTGLPGYMPSLPLGFSDTLELLDPLGAVLLHIEYSTDAPWPIQAFAAHSLVLSNPSYGENDPRAWTASPKLWQLDITGTTPVPPPRGTLRLNELRTGAGGFLEIYNPSSTAASLNNFFLTANENLNFVAGAVLYNLPGAATVAAGGFYSIPLSSLNFTLASTGGQVFLVDSTGYAVVDGLVYGAQDTTVAIGRTPNGLGGFVRLTAATSGASNAAALVDPVVISEIMYHPVEPAGADYEFIELHNRSGAQVNLTNWRLRGSIQVDFNDASRNYTIAAGGRLVVPEDRGDFRALYGLPSGTTWLTNGYASGSNPNLPNSSGRILLQNASGVTIDEVSYRDGEGWPEEADAGGSSLELIDPRVDNNVKEGWAASDESSQTVLETVSFNGTIANDGTPVSHVEIFLGGKGECYIDDVVVRREPGTNLVLNPDFEVSFDHWTPEGTHEWSERRGDGGTGGGPCLHLKASDRGDYVANRVIGELASGALSNDGGAIVIEAQARWVSGSPHLVIRLRGHGGEAIGALVVPSSGGTPNAPNSRGLANGTPLISDAAHNPVLPASNQAVTVTARILDATTVTVNLDYRLDPSTDIATVAMNDAGTGADLRAGDRVFTGVIPVLNQAEALLAYTITAADSEGGLARFPAGGPVWPDDTVGRECLIRYDEQQPASGYDSSASYKNHFPSYHLWMTSATQARWETRDQGSNSDLDVTFAWNNGRVIYNTGAHYSGSFHHRPEFYGPTQSNNQGYNLRFPSAQQFLNRDSADIDSNSANYISFREQTAHWLAGKLGLQSTHRRFCHFFANNTRIGTVYEDVQEPGGDYLDEYFPGDEGNLFKLEVQWSGSSTLDLGGFDNGNLTFSAPFSLLRKRWLLQKRATDTPNDYSVVAPLVDAFNQPDPQFTPSVAALADTAQWMNASAFERIIGNMDAYGWDAQHNMYAYKPEGTEPWQLLIYDTDYFTAWWVPSTELIPTAHEPALMVARPQFLREYLQALRAAHLSGVLNGGIQAKMDTLHALLVAEHPTAGIYPDGAFVPPDYFYANVGYTPKTYFNQRHNAIGTLLAPFSSSLLAVTSSDTTGSETYVLEGTAPPAARSIRINGAPAAIEWFESAPSNPSGWRITLTLAIGDNELIIEALDKSNAVIGSPLNFTVNYAIPASAAFVRTDSSTRGAWIGTYGTRGHWLPGDSVSMLDPVSVSSGAAEYDWPESGIGSGLLRATSPQNAYQYCVHSPDNQPGGVIDVDVVSGDTEYRQVSLYMYDFDFSWGGDPRVQRIEVRDPGTGALLSSRAITRFERGKYLTWRVRGNVLVRIIYLTGAWNSVLSGVFIDPDGHVGNGEVFLDDSTSAPAGATFVAESEPWNWSTTLTPAYSGTQNHTSSYSTWVHQHYFWGATETIINEPDDVVYSWARIDNTVPILPSEVMLQWYVTDGRQWNNRAYWGTDFINYWGPRVYAGPVPTAGQWVRLEMPAWKLGLAGVPVSGMAFTLYKGRTVWDLAGRETGQAADSDDDNLPDAWEMAKLGNLSQGPAGDPDGDYLVNLAELYWSSNPTAVDTDGDSLTDGDEALWYLSDPMLADSDADGWTDNEELFTYGTSPTSNDTDADGLYDSWEVWFYSTSPTQADTDGDSWSDGDEVNTHFTDPNDPDSHP